MLQYVNQLFSQCEFLFTFVLAFIFYRLCHFHIYPWAKADSGNRKESSGIILSKRLDYCWTEFSGRTVLDLRNSDNKSVLRV